MSWFGETFGDSLNTLKGQITKITKEVLAETDETAIASEEQESSASVLKEVEALSRSKDLEVASLREELNKLHHHYISQLEFYKNQNAKINTNCDNDLQIQQFAQLKNELHQLRQERDHLNSCLDELQLEHQANLNEVINIRDKYKIELEELRIEYNIIKTKLDELIKNQNEILKSNDSAKGNEGKESEINSLNNQMESFFLPTKLDEKEKAISALKKETLNQQVLKEKLEKLPPSDIEAINKDKQKTEEINKAFQFENENLKSKMSLIKQDNKEIEIKLKMVLNEKEELIKKLKCKESERSKLSTVLVNQLEVEKKIKTLLKMLNINADFKSNEFSVIGCLSLIENELIIRQKHQQETNAKVREVAHDLESEVNKLKEEKEYLQNEMKISTEKWTETEKECQEEISGLQKIITEMKTQRQHCINQSQTDDVKRLEQEVAQFMNLLLTKNNEIKDYSKSVNNLEQELGNLKTKSLNIERELGVTNKEKRKLEEEVEQLKNKYFAISQEKINLQEKLRNVESENSYLKKINAEFQQKTTELAELSAENVRMKTLEAELEKAQLLRAEAENCCTELQKANLDLKNEFEDLKAQVIIKETSLVELMKSNTAFQEEINKIQAQRNELQNAEREIKKWKDASVDLEIQRQDLLSKKEELENECLALRSELELFKAEVAEMTQLRQTDSDVMESGNQLQHELESKAQSEKLYVAKESKLEERCQKQVKLISELQEENDELKSRVHKFQEQMKVQMIQSQSQPTSKDDVQQHRRSKSAIDMETSPIKEIQKPGVANGEDMSVLKHVIEQEQAKYRSLQGQFQEISEKESNARKEFERLKQHLIEIEDHYTEEAVENGKIINDLKCKLTAAEEQLQNSSTLYTSMKVRDNQHLESLQSQIRLMSTQRDDFQAKLSTAEDEVQKHKASLMSLQIVLEQFQQDKEREVEGIAVKYEKQLQMTHGRFQELEAEIEGLKKQLAEAKNGLKAASRLGEQLEKKKEQVAELEGSLTRLKERVRELEDNLTAATQSGNAKIDKSLIKNLVVGYVLSRNTDRKSQVLKIMASVLDFDQDERSKMGVDSTYSGWLSNILHPKGGGSSSNQSLSEAFIRFLENESRPQAQVKFSPEQFESKTTKLSEPASASPQQKSGRFSEFMLPTFNSSQENESSVILKSVLNDS